MARSGSPPVVYDVRFPENLSRGLAVLKLLFGWLYVGIPHGIILYLYGIAAWVTSLIAFVSILINGKYPEGLFNFNLGYYRWNARVNAYMGLLTDEYPPFTPEPVTTSPVDVRIQRPESLSKGLALLKFFLGWIYVGIPHGLILLFYSIAVLFTSLLAFFSILFTGRYPIGLFRFAVALNRWDMRVNAYLSFMRDEYPPFHGRPAFSDRS